jgi:hypothetical protein
MRAARLLLAALAVAPSLTLAAPINPAHYEELEARWNPFHMSSQQKQNVKNFGKGFAQGVSYTSSSSSLRTVDPILNSLLLLVNSSAL